MTSSWNESKLIGFAITRVAMEAKLFESHAERERIENMAEIYSIIVTTDGLEKAYVRDAVKEGEYGSACAKLIAQYATCVLLDSTFSLAAFCAEYNLSCPAAVRRLQIGVPATSEQSDAKSTSKYVAEIVQCFITLMDSLKLNLVDVDQIHPLLVDLVQSLSKLKAENAKLREWMSVVGALGASDKLSEKQVRQLLFDLENAHSSFYRSLSEK